METPVLFNQLFLISAVNFNWLNINYLLFSNPLNLKQLRFYVLSLGNHFICCKNMNFINSQQESVQKNVIVNLRVGINLLMFSRLECQNSWNRIFNQNPLWYRVKYLSLWNRIVPEYRTFSVPIDIYAKTNLSWQLFSRESVSVSF